eukprot:6211769-Pleurochrysis_carterae.AAC.4
MLNGAADPIWDPQHLQAAEQPLAGRGSLDATGTPLKVATGAPPGVLRDRRYLELELPCTLAASPPHYSIPAGSSHARSYWAWSLQSAASPTCATRTAASVVVQEAAKGGGGAAEGAYAAVVAAAVVAAAEADDTSIRMRAGRLGEQTRPFPAGHPHPLRPIQTWAGSDLVVGSQRLGGMEVAQSALQHQRKQARLEMLRHACYHAQRVRALRC